MCLGYITEFFSICISVFLVLGCLALLPYTLVAGLPIYREIVGLGLYCACLSQSNNSSYIYKSVVLWFKMGDVSFINNGIEDLTPSLQVK